MASDGVSPALAAYKCDCSDHESAVSPSAYLADLLEYATDDGPGSGHVTDEDGPVSIDDLEETFHQPFAAISASPETAKETVRHVRICVEALLGYLEAGGPEESGALLDLSDDGGGGSAVEIPAQSETAAYRSAAYEALLDSWGVTREDLRAAAYDESERGWVAEAIGVPEWAVPDLWLDPDAPLSRQYEDFPRQSETSLFASTDKTFPVSEANLEDIFGLPVLTKSTNSGRTRADPLRSIEAPYIRLWRIQYLREEWAEEDHPSDAYPRHLHENTPYTTAQLSDESTRPIIDPDLIGPDDFRVIPEGQSFSRRDAFPSDDAAFSLWERRRKWIDGELESIWTKLPVKPDPSDDLRGVLNGMLSPASYPAGSGEQVWYPGHGGSPTKVPASQSSSTGADGPFAGWGFLEDFGLLYRQLTGDAATASQARTTREQSAYPTGDSEAPPAEAARTVIEAQLHLPVPAFRRLVELLGQYYAADETVDTEEWWEVASIVAGARKRSLFQVWINEETGQEDVHLDRTTFWQAQREPQQGEWSLRLDRHDPLDPDVSPAPYIDPEVMDRADLPERPRGQVAHDRYETRQQQLQDKRASLTDTFEAERRRLQSAFESMQTAHDTERQRLTSGSSIPSDESTIDGILDTEYGSVSWASQRSDWESRFSWLHEGLQLRKRQQQPQSSLSSAEQQQVTDVEQKLDALRLSPDEFRELHRLRERGKLAGADDEGLDAEDLRALFGVLPKGNPLDPVLTAAYDPKQSNNELAPIYNAPDQHWDPLFDAIRTALESQSGPSGASRPPELTALDLSVEEFESVLSLRQRALPGPSGEAPPEALVTEVINLLTSAWKRAKHYTTGRDSWLTLERDRGKLSNYWDAYKAQLPQWRATREDRAQWQQALYRRCTAPIVDPDLLEGVDDFETPAWKKDAFDLWSDRQNTLTGSKGSALVTEIEQLRTDAQQGNHKLSQSAAAGARTDIDAALTRTVGTDLAGLRAIHEAMAQGEDAGVRLGRLDLSPSALSYILELDDQLGTQPIRVEEWESLRNILLQAWKQRQYGRWKREERAFDVTLEPQQFDLPDPSEDREPPAEDDPLRWRVEWSIRTQWEDILETRIDQLEAVDEEIEAAVAAAETAALPIFRETLLDRLPAVDPSPGPDTTAEWVSERLLIDTEMYGGQETTRTSQAITSLQDLLQSLNLNLDDRNSGLAGAGLALEDPKFDQRWRWLGSYDNWQAAMGVYMYPENVVLPTLRRRTTGRFDRIARQLSRTRDLTEQRVHEAAATYREYLRDVMSLSPAAGCMAPRRESVGSPGTEQDDSDPLAYVFGQSSRSGTCYVKAVDPDLQSTAHADSTWTAIPIEETVEAVHGASTYQESIYLFVSIRSSDGAGTQNDATGSNGSTGRDVELACLRYDLLEGTWEPPQSIDLPTEVRDVSLNQDLKLEQIESAAVVVTAGWFQPPEVVVDVAWEDHQSVSSETKSRFLVRLNADGSVPSGDNHLRLEITTSPIVTAFGLGGDARATVSKGEYRAFELRGEINRSGEVAGLNSQSMKTIISRWAELTTAIYRPNEEQILFITDGPAATWYSVDGTGALSYQFKYAVGDMPAPSELFQCNNVSGTWRGTDSDTTGQMSVQENVLVAEGTAPEFRTRSSVTWIPVLMELRGTEDSTPGGMISTKHPLVPALTPSVAVDVSRTGRYPPRLDGVDDLSNYLSDHADNARAFQEATVAPNHVYVAEAYYHLPLFIARQLTRAGEYEAALRWFRTVYDFTASGDPSDPRAIWPDLQPEGPKATSAPGTDWLLDPIDPHAIAETRANPHTKFTLFSIVRCLSEFGDDEFTQDTPKSVANATDLYEEALDLLESGVLNRDTDPCRDLIVKLNTSIFAHVIEPEIWTGTQGLTQTEVEAKTDELVRVVEGIDDYSDRQKAVSEIQTHLESGALDKALDVANQYQKSEQDPSPFDGRVTTVIASMAGGGSQTQTTERRLMSAANRVRGRSDGAVDGSSGDTTDSTTISRAEVLGASTTDPISPDNIDAVGLRREETVIPRGLAEADTGSGTTTSEVNDASTSDSSGDSGAGETAAGGSSDGQESTGTVRFEYQPTVEDEALEVAESSGESGPGAATVDAATMDIIEATKHQFCIPKNPLLTSLRRHAEVNLEKIRTGRNIAGMKRELDPYASSVSVESATPTPTGGGAVSGLDGGITPTNYRYETLIDRAKELAKQARQFETELLTAIEKAERQEYKLKKARQQVDLAEQRVALQETRLERAQAKVELARLKRERARIRRDTYRAWHNNPQPQVQKAITHLQVAMGLQYGAAGLHTAAAVFHGIAASMHFGAASVYTITQRYGQSLSAMASGFSSVGATLTSAAAALSSTAGALSTQAQILQIQARKQRRRRRWRLKKRVAQKNYEIGTQRMEIARDTVAITRQERAIATLRADHAEDIVNFHEQKFTNEELYQWIADVLEGVYRYFLQQAAAVGKMAQRQLAFKRQGLPREFVQSDYWEAPTQGQTAVPAAQDGQQGDAVPDRRGMTGSARLLQDIYELDQHEFVTAERRLQVEKTVSVSELDPLALQQFRETGMLSFATTLEDFDVDHPGHYHRLIEDVEVTVVALTPPTEGINATLRSSGTSRVVVKDTLFQEQTIDRDPEQVVLNRARGREADDELRLRPRDREMLRPFEHSGVATDWELEMPRPANDMDYGTIVDVQLTIEYSALESYEYRQQVISELEPERTVERSFSFHDDFGDAWYDLVNAPESDPATTVTFETDREDFPSNLFGLSLEGVQLYFAVSGPNRADQRENLKDLQVEFGPADGSGTTSKATNGRVDLGTLDTDGVDQEWELTVTPTNMADPFADGTIEDVLLIMTANGEVGNWPP